MNTDKKNEEVDVNEAAITLEVDSEVIDKVRKGEITHILMDIDEDNQNLVLENAGGNLILVTDEMPTTFHLKWKNVRTKEIVQAHVPNANLNCAI